jgi:hypothetical protein
MTLTVFRIALLPDPIGLSGAEAVALSGTNSFFTMLVETGNWRRPA